MKGLNNTITNSFEQLYKKEHDLFAAFVMPILPILLLAGLTSNMLNIVTFLKIGVKDSVTTLLLALSISDGTFICLFSPLVLRHGFSYLGTFRVNALYQVYLLFYWPAFTVYDFSAYISVFLGVTRCACVAMPLRFKSVFTTKRTVLSIIVLFCVDVLLHLPVLTIFKVRWKTDPVSNTTFLAVVGESRDVHFYKQSLNDIINKNTIQVISFITMVTCTFLLRYKLYESSKVRSKPASVTRSGEGKDGSNQKKSHELSAKDVRVVQSVILVCSIYIMAQLPSLIYTALRNTHPDFSFSGRFFYIGRILPKATFVIYLLNASVNIFVYYNYNSKYRSILRLLFRLNNNQIGKNG